MKNSISRLRFWVLMAAVVSVAAIAMILAMPKQEAAGANPLKGRFSSFSKPDAVTADIRDAAKNFFRVVTPDASSREMVSRFGRIVADYGPFVIISADNGSEIERSGLEIQPIETAISLPGVTFDPVKDPPAATLRPGSLQTGKGYYIIQFGGTATGEWLDSLRDAGIEILQYVPHNAFYVYADGEAISKAATHSRVRWVGEFLPEHKMSTILSEQLSAARSNMSPGDGISPIEMTKAGSAIFDIAVFKRANLNEIAARIAADYGGVVKNAIDLPNNYFNFLRVELPLDRIQQTLDIPDVITADAAGTPRAEDEKAAQIVAGNYTSTTAINGPGYNPLTQFGVNGSGVTVSVVDDGVSFPGDGGFYVTSAMAVDGPLRGSTSGATGHGHLNASIIAGTTPFSATLDANGYNYGLGIAPAANIINIPLLKGGYTGVEADCYNDTVVTNGPNGVKGFISNNSWGNGTNSNVYDAYTAQFDGFVRDASAAASIDPILLVFSAGNSGPAAASLTRPKAAKNMISTGSSENIRTNLDSGSNNIDDLSSFSSRGPAADGRIKPDIVAPGQAITGSRAGTDALFGNIDTFHRWSEGTSHAAPQVAGAAALFTQFWKTANGGANPSPALVKAAIINTGQEMGGVNATTPVPNGNEGWGRINMKFMLNTGVGMKYVDQTTTFTDPGNSSTISGTVADASKPTRVTLVWTDPPGAANANPALVNNLDLSVTIGANTYKGNVFTAGVSTTGGAADAINNVENVWLPAGIPAGTGFSITVSATAINGDGVLGNADTTDQNFALVAYNFAQVTVKSRADFDGDGKTDFSVFRPSNGVWYLNKSTGGFAGYAWGTSGDTIVPGDWDGDGKADTAVYRPTNTPGAADFYVLNSSGFTFTGLEWGVVGDIALTGDYDGDGKADAAVFRPSNGTWYVRGSLGPVLQNAFGQNGDVPLAIDNDGDGKTNLAIYRLSDNKWYIARSTGVPAQNFDAITFGLSTDLRVPADYDGDNKEDVAVFRPSTGQWFILRSSNGAVDITTYGTLGDIPVPGDYDGDGKDDIAVYRAGTWYANRSTAGSTVVPFGVATDIPVPKGYIP